MSWLNQPVVVDLFCGVGGLSLGFEQAGFRMISAVDCDPINTNAHLRNFPKCKTITGDMLEVTGKQIRSISGVTYDQIDVVIGGAPCQGFSLIGKRRPDDPRNLLIFEFARIVRELQPKYWVMENVDGLMMGDAKLIMATFIEEMKESGYNIVEPIKILNSKNYGVPQNRRRVFVLGYRKDMIAPKYPESRTQNSDTMLTSTPTVWDAISDLNCLENFEDMYEEDNYLGNLDEGTYYSQVLRGLIKDPGDYSKKRGKKCKVLSGCRRSLHTKQTIHRFKKTKPGDYEPISRFYRLPKNDVSNTLRAGTDKAHGGFTAARPIHPVNPRCITVREAARLHSFPDWFQFDSTIWHGFRQIGNSVPPFLARAVGLEIMKAIKT
jgi:DNA (cytosine-5)-methyltransferase 1